MLKLRSSITSTVRPFKNHSNAELLNALLISSYCAHPQLVKSTNRILDASITTIGMQATCFYLSKTVGKVFSAGETLEELTSVLSKLGQEQMGCIIDYCAEGETSLEGLDKNEEAIINAAMLVSDHVYPSVAVKVTSLIDTKLLRKLNEFQQRKLVEGSEKYMPIFNEEFLETVNSEFLPTEITEISNCMKRLRRIANLCKDKRLTMMIDAEQTYFQTAIDSIA